MDGGGEETWSNIKPTKLGRKPFSLEGENPPIRGRKSSIGGDNNKNVSISHDLTGFFWSKCFDGFVLVKFLMVYNNKNGLFLGFTIYMKLGQGNTCWLGWAL